MQKEDLEVHLPGPPGGPPRAPPPSALGLRSPITYINSLVQPGPICRPPPHLGSPRQPAHARWWLGGVAVRGGPRSLSPHLTPPPGRWLRSSFPFVHNFENWALVGRGPCHCSTPDQFSTASYSAREANGCHRALPAEVSGAMKTS